MEEKISKQKAKQLFESGDITQVEVYEDAVALKPAEVERETRLDAGKKALFDRQKIHHYLLWRNSFLS